MVFQSCRILNPSVMLKTGRGYQYAAFPPSQPVEYKIAPNDALSFQIFPNDGFQTIDRTAISGGSASMQGGTGAGLRYKVEFDGTVKMPLLGYIKMQGLTVREAEFFLEEKFSVFYNKPFVLLEVTNRKVTIFPGSEGSAKVIALQNENTTLFEALAQAGGIASSGKAYKIKLIRGDLKNPQIYLIDLSTIEGMKKADLYLQSNDIIYVEPSIRIEKEIMGEIFPYLSFLTTIILAVAFFKVKIP